MNLTEVTAGLKSRAESGTPLGKTVKFDFGGDGMIYVDGNNGNAVSNDDNAADCTISMTMGDFVDMAEGRLNPMNAFMGGKLKVAGDMSVAMKLQSIIG